MNETREETIAELKAQNAILSKRLADAANSLRGVLRCQEKLIPALESAMSHGLLNKEIGTVLVLGTESVMSGLRISIEQATKSD